MRALEGPDTLWNRGRLETLVLELEIASVTAVKRADGGHEALGAPSALERFLRRPHVPNGFDAPP